MEDFKMALITEAFVNQYKANIELLAQQQESKLSSAVRVEMQDAEYSNYEQMAKFTTLTTNPARNADTVIISSQHERRRVSLNSYFWAELVDKFDEEDLNDIDCTETEIDTSEVKKEIFCTKIKSKTKSKSKDVLYFTLFIFNLINALFFIYFLINLNITLNS